MQTLMILSSFLSAIATIVIAIYAGCTYKLTRQIDLLAKQSRQDQEDLFEAIVIATIISGPTSTGDFEKAIRSFNEKYKGQRKIFKSA